MKRLRRALPWVLFAISATFMAAGRMIELIILDPGVEQQAFVEEVGFALAFLSFPAIGALIATRQRDNAVGWLLCGIGALASIGVMSMAWARVALEEGRDLIGGILAAWIYNWFWYPLMMVIPTFLLLVFPTGHLPSRRWRPVAWLAGGFMAAITIPAMLQEWIVGDGFRVRNPVGFIPGNIEETLEPLFLLFTPVALLCASSLVVRAVRGRGDERQQLKWVAAAAGMMTGSFLAGDLFGLPEVLFPVVLVFLPVAIGIAILKYRLYDIDVIINRAMVYAVLTALLVGTYAIGVLVFRTLLDPVTADNDAAIAASTLAVAALFGPARRRIQAFIDRRFYRARYDAQRTLEEFASGLRDEVELAAISNEMLSAVHRTLRPAHAAVVLLESKEG